MYSTNIILGLRHWADRKKKPNFVNIVTVMSNTQAKKNAMNFGKH